MQSSATRLKSLLYVYCALSKELSILLIEKAITITLLQEKHHEFAMWHSRFAKRREVHVV